MWLLFNTFYKFDKIERAKIRAEFINLYCYYI